MTTALHILAALVVAAILTLLALLFAFRGIGRTWPEAPGGPLRYRLVLKSPLARIIRRLQGKGPGDPNNALSLFGSVHVALGHVSRRHIAHEIGHLVNARWYGAVGYVWRYLTNGRYRRNEEVLCDEFAHRWQQDGHMVNAERYRKGEG